MRDFKSPIGLVFVCAFALKALIGAGHVLLLTPPGAHANAGEPCPMHREAAEPAAPESCVCEAGHCCIGSADRFAHTADEFTLPVSPMPSPVLSAFAKAPTDITPLLAYASRAPPGVSPI